MVLQNWQPATSAISSISVLILRAGDDDIVDLS